MLFENILNPNDLAELQKAIEYEVTNFPCLMVPKYQSYATMHTKYRHYQWWKNFEALVIDNARLATGGENYSVQTCWFNICKQDSNFDWHQHRGVDMTCVYYAKNCNDLGTYVKLDGQVMKMPAKDNGLVYMEPEIEHRVPPWEGQDRFSVAFQLVKKTHSTE